MRLPSSNAAMEGRRSARAPSPLSPEVAEVSQELLRTFPHTKRVGNYLLGRTLGEGSFAKVKESLHTLTGEKVAVKVVDKKKAREDVYVRKNLRREGRLLQLVRHPHVVRLYEVLETENSYYLVTELCRGGDLMDYICARKRLDERDTRRFVTQILLAVDYLHTVGILHRDLKVENLLLDENRNIKIIDFGLSNAVRVSQSKGGPNFQEFCVTQCGSPAYAAPELLGNKKYGPKVDVWSIGVNMYAMVTGSLPYTVEPFNIKALYNKMLNGDMNAIPSHLSKDCKDLLRKFLTPDPEKRISVKEALRHPWVMEGGDPSAWQVPFPNRLTASDLNESILQHMADNLDFRLSEVIRLVAANIPNQATSTYFLLQQKWAKWKSSQRGSHQGSHSQSRLGTSHRKDSGGQSNAKDQVTPAQIIELVPIANAKPDPSGTTQSHDARTTPARSHVRHSGDNTRTHTTEAEGNNNNQATENTHSTLVPDNITFEDISPAPKINELKLSPRRIPSRSPQGSRRSSRKQQVTSNGSERRVLSAALHPDFPPDAIAVLQATKDEEDSTAADDRPCPSTEPFFTPRHLSARRPSKDISEHHTPGSKDTSPDLPSIGPSLDESGASRLRGPGTDPEVSRRPSKQWAPTLVARTQDGACWSRTTVQSLGRHVSPRERPEPVSTKSPQSERRVPRTQTRPVQGQQKKVMVDNVHYDRFARRNSRLSNSSDRSPSHKLLTAQFSETRPTRAPTSPHRLAPARVMRKGSVETLGLGQALLAVSAEQGIPRPLSNTSARGLVRRKSYEVPLGRSGRASVTEEKPEVERLASPRTSQMALVERGPVIGRENTAGHLPAISPPLLNAKKHHDNT